MTTLPRWTLWIAIAGSTVCGSEPPIIEAVRNRDMVQLRELIVKRAGLSSRGTQNQTALHEAATTCNVEAARLLVQAGLDRSALNREKRTAGALAFHCKDPDTLRELVRVLWIPRPAEAGNAGQMARWTLQDAAARGDANVMDMLLKLGADANALDANGDRALEVACRNGNVEAVEVLLIRGADVKLMTSSGTSALHEASLGGNARVIELLIEHGAQVDALDREKAATPLHYAASFGRLDAVKVLVRHGADIRRKDRSGRDAIAVATAAGFADVAKFLQGASNSNERR